MKDDLTFSYCPRSDAWQLQYCWGILVISTIAIIPIIPIMIANIVVAAVSSIIVNFAMTVSAVAVICLAPLRNLLPPGVYKYSSSVTC